MSKSLGNGIDPLEIADKYAFGGVLTVHRDVPALPAGPGGNLVAPPELPGLETIRVIGDSGVINENGGPYNGMDRYECRKAIVRDLEEQGFLVKTEEPVPKPNST